MEGRGGTVVVVGSGIAGASAAFHLAARGTRVVLVDDGRLGRATDAGAGIVGMPWRGLGTPLADLRRRGVEAYAAIASSVGAAVDWVGELLVAPGGAEIDRAEAMVASAPGGPGRRLPSSEARSLFPYLAPELEAVHVASTARVEGAHVRDRLAAAGVGAGAEIVHGTAELRLTGGRVTSVVVGDRRLAATDVVVAAGAWSSRLLADAGVASAVPVAPQRGQIVHLHVREDTGAMPVVSPLGADHYLLAFPDHRVVAGASRETGSGFEPVSTAGGLAAVLADALRVAPGLAPARLREVRVGLRPQTPDGLPVLGPLPGCAGIWLLTGMGPQGLTLGPYCGRLVAEALVGREPEVDLAPFSPSRSPA